MFGVLKSKLMIHYTISKTKNDLTDIIELQKKNLVQNLTSEEIEKFGFVTVSHSMEVLSKMSSYEQHIIARDKDLIVGYLLAMTKFSRNDIPILIPMFDTFDQISYKGKRVSKYNYLVVGQVCIHKDFRGIGLLDNCYKTYKNYFKNKYDFAITEIANTNKRSLNAHLRIGFKEIHRYIDSQHTEWSIVVLDW